VAFEFLYRYAIFSLVPAAVSQSFTSINELSALALQLTANHAPLRRNISTPDERECDFWLQSSSHSANMAASANLIGIYVSVLLKYPPNSTVQGTVAQIVPHTSTLVLREGKNPRIVLN
jgi:hypothetical protein